MPSDWDIPVTEDRDDDRADWRRRKELPGERKPSRSESRPHDEEDDDSDGPVEEPARRRDAGPLDIAPLDIAPRSSRRERPQYQPRPSCEPPEESGSGRLWVILAGVGGIGLLAVGLCVGAFVGFINEIGKQVEKLEAPIEMPPPVVESPAEKRAELVAAFSKEEPLPAESVPEGMREFFDSLVAATSSDDVEAYRRLFDATKMFEEVKRAGFIKHLTVQDDSQGGQWVHDSLHIPDNWTRHSILHVRNVSGSESVAYVVFDDGGDSFEELRCWLARSGNRWKLYDYERVQYGFRESRELAIYYANTGDPRLTAYDEVLNKVRESYNTDPTGTVNVAEKSLREAAETLPRVLPEFQSVARLWVANGWYQHGYSGEAVALHKSISNPDDHPGAHLWEARSWQSLGRPGRALEAIDRYTKAIGRSPNVARVRAGSLVELGRAPEAISEWMAVLKLRPDNPGTLYSMASAVAAVQREQALELVRRTGDPVESAAQLVDSLHYGDRIDLVEALIEIVAKSEPDAPRTQQLRGILAEMKGDVDAATALYLKALQSEPDDDKKHEFRYEYLRKMIEANRTLEAYENADDPQKAFAALTGGGEDDDTLVDDKDLKLLVEKHRAKFPEDPRGLWQSGVLLCNSGKPAEAEKELTAALAKADPDGEDGLKYAIENDLARCLIEQGKVADAYRTHFASEEGFQRLAMDLRWRQRPAELRKLIDAHRAVHAGDPFIRFYEAIATEQEGKFDEAFAAYTDLAKGSQQTQVSNMARWARQSAIFSSPDPMAAAVGAAAVDEFFPQLATRLADEKRWDDLGAILERRRLAAPQDPLLATWDARLPWEKKDYNAVIQKLAAAPAPKKARYSYSNDATSAQMLVRSYVRTGRVNDAVASAKKLEEFAADDVAPIVAFTAARDVDSLLSYFSTLSQNSPVLMSCFWDEDAGPILRSAEFLRVRQQYPPGIPHHASRSRIVLMRSAPWDAAGDAARDAIAAAFGDGANVEALPKNEDKSPVECWIVTRGAERYVVASGSDQFSDAWGEDADGALSSEKSPVQKQVGGHRGWIALGALRLDGTATDADAKTVGAAAAALMGDDTVVVSADELGRAAPASAELRDALRVDGVTKKAFAKGEALWIFRNASDDSEENLPPLRLTAFREALDQRKDGESFEVDLRMTLGAATELLTLTVEKTVPQRYGGSRYVGTLRSASRLLPELAAGEPLGVDTYQIENWRIRSGESVREGRKPAQTP